MSQYALTHAQIDSLSTHKEEYAAMREESYHLGFLEPPENPKDAFICKGCGVNTGDIFEYYSLKLKVWLKANQGLFRGMRCLGCAEAGLGRELTTADFTDAPVNYWFPMSAKMFTLVAPIQKKIIDDSPIKKKWKRAEYADLQRRLDFITANPDATVVR